MDKSRISWSPYPTGELVTRADGAVAEVWAPRLKRGDIAKHVRYGAGVVREIEGDRVKFRPHKRRGSAISEEGEWVASVELEFLMRFVPDTGSS